MQTKLTFLLIIMSLHLPAQTTYKIKGFSDKYYGEVIINSTQENEYFTKGTISIFNAKTNEEVIKLTSDSVILNFDDQGEVTTNVQEIYGEQSIIISKDFNFDGKKDIAIMDGQYSCYGGASYQIYLQINNTLQHSPEFTQLGQEFCGMFEVHKDRKIISTFTKSGCCWHQFSEYKVENNKPVVIKIIEEGSGKEGITIDYLEKKRVGNKLVETSYQEFTDDADLTELYSLTFKNGKKMKLYSAFENRFLLYAFINNKEKIELMYYDEFNFNTKKGTLSFNNKNTTYQIHSGGIKVVLPNRNIDLESLDIGKDLSFINDLSLSNLIIE